MSEVSEDHVLLPTRIVDQHRASPAAPQETGNFYFLSDGEFLIHLIIAAESKLSRKREREVSLEPPTPKVNVGIDLSSWRIGIVY